MAHPLSGVAKHAAQMAATVAVDIAKDPVKRKQAVEAANAAAEAVKKAAPVVAPTVKKASEAVKQTGEKAAASAKVAANSTADVAKRAATTAAATTAVAANRVAESNRKANEAIAEAKAERAAAKAARERAAACLTHGYAFSTSEAFAVKWLESAEENGGASKYMAAPDCYAILTYKKSVKEPQGGFADVFVGCSENVGQSVMEHLFGLGNVDVYADYKFKRPQYVIFFRCNAGEIDTEYARLVEELGAMDSYNAEKKLLG